MATFVAGFGSLGIGVDMLEVYENFALNDEFAWRRHAGRVCTFLSTLTLFLSLWVICVVLTVVPHARRWALEGPVEAVEDAARKLKTKLNTVTNVFTASLFTFILERVSNCLLFDLTAPVAPFMYLTGGVVVFLITREYREASRLYSETTFKHRAFPQRPPESYRELGAMERMSVMLQGHSSGPLLGPGLFPPSRQLSPRGRRLTTTSSAPRRHAPPLPPAAQHSPLLVCKMAKGKEISCAKRYVSLDKHALVVYATYEDFILDRPNDGTRINLSDYKLAEPVDDGSGKPLHFDLYPIAATWQPTFRFRVETAKGHAKWVGALRTSFVEMDGGLPPSTPPAVRCTRAGSEELL